ncbi:MAG TPA: OmpA family protein [Rhizomicrobium sp.]|nr:OmpA family protein [Rhizomicrobium sp.]
MRLTSLLAIAAGFLLANTGVSLAQNVVTGQEIQVNPLPPGGGVVLYPGGEYSRMVPPLLYPGEKGGPIHLHMPTRHHVAVAKAAPTETQAEPAPKPKPKPRRMASATPPPPKPAPEPAPAPPPQAPAANPFGGPDLSNVFGNHPQQQASAAPPPKPAKTAPAGPVTGNENLTKLSVILFAKDAPDPAQGALGAIKFLASNLNSHMSTPNARVELQAFGGAKGDKGSDARRLSLKRALSIRQVLIDDGVSADRIDVRAMGGVDDTGPADRVDVYVKA